MSLNSLKRKLDQDRAKHEAFKAGVEDRVEANHKEKSKGVSPGWIAVIVGVALLVVLGVLIAFPPAALEEWGVGVDLSDQEYDIPGAWDAGGHEPDAGPEEEPEPEETMRRRRSTMMTTTMEEDDGLGMDSNDPIDGVSAEDDPLGGLPL